MRIVSFGLLILSLFYALLKSGGVMPPDWRACLAAIGLSGVLLWTSRRDASAAPPLSRTLCVGLTLIGAFAVFQLAPLPIELVRRLSPARAELHDALDAAIGARPYAALSVAPSETLDAIAALAAYMVVFLVVRELAVQWRGRRWLLAIPFLMAAALEAALGLVQHFLFSLPAATGTYVNRNHFAGMLAMALPFAVLYTAALLRNEPSDARQSSLGPAVRSSLGLILAAGILAAIVRSLSRMGFVAALSALLVAGLFAANRKRKGRRRWLTAAAIAASALLAFFLLPTDQLIYRFADLVQSSERMNADTRAAIWGDTWELIQAFPLFGCGLGAYRHGLYPFRTAAPTYTVDMAHNDYLQLLAEFGFLGFGILLALALRTFLLAARTAQGPDASDGCLAIASAGALTAAGLHGLVDFNLHIPANAMLLAWIAGIVEGVSADASRAASPDGWGRIPGSKR